MTTEHVQSEKTIINKILVYFSENGNRAFRQNVGMGWTGKFIKNPMRTSIILDPSDVVIKNARPLHAGLCTGSSDIIGWKRIIITPDMVGKTYAVFTAIEVKYGNTKTTPEQDNFINVVNSSGGFGKIVHSFEEARLWISEK